MTDTEVGVIVAGEVVMRKLVREDGSPYCTATFNRAPMTEFGPGALKLMNLLMQDMAYAIMPSDFQTIREEQK